MKENKSDRNKFKNYWRLIFKSRFDLNINSWKKFRCFKDLMTEIDVIDYLLSKSSILENTYDLYQDILYYLQHRDYNGFNRIINKEYNNLSTYMEYDIKDIKKIF